MKSVPKKRSKESASVMRHFAGLGATFAATAIPCLGLLLWWSSWDGTVHERLTNYHVASLRLLDEAEDILSSTPHQKTCHATADIGSTQGRHGQMLSVSNRLGEILVQLSKTHQRYKEPALDLPHMRLQEAVRYWRALEEDHDTHSEAILHRASLDLETRVEQLERFHTILYRESSREDEDFAQSAVWVLVGSMAIFMAVGGTLARRLYRSLNAILRQQEKTTVELMEARVQADAANDAKSKFLANMSHEIRTPMTGVLGFAEQLLDPELTQSQRLESARIIHRSGEHLLGIINDILDVAKLEAGKMTVSKEPCDPNLLAKDAIETFASTAHAKGVALRVEHVNRSPRSIDSDPIRLRQILLNVVGNAIKFTDQGSVTVRLRFAEDNTVVFDVLDTGIGMTPDQAASLFQPFSQVNSAETAARGGTGLGLAISRKFANLLGGDLQILHTAPGDGTCFRITIDAGNPRFDDTDAPQEQRDVKRENFETTHDGATSRLRGIRILCAEDNPTNQLLIRRILEKEEAEVTIVSNGKEAVDHIGALRDRETSGAVEQLPNAVVLDMQMPVMNGYQVAKRIRQQGISLPIIALTASATATDSQRALAAGCDRHLAKPINSTVLIETIRSLVEQPIPI